MTVWSGYLRHPLVILTCSVLSAVAVAGLAGPWMPAGSSVLPAEGPASAALPFSGASLTPQGEALPVTPVVHTSKGAPSTNPEVAVNATDPRLANAARLTLSTHVVVAGETLVSIAAHYGSDPETLEGLNPDLGGGSLNPGMKLRVLNGRGALYTLREGETLAAIAQRFWVAEAKLLAANGLLSADQAQPGQQLILPGVKPRRRDDALASRGLGPLYFVWPTRGWLTSGFGARWGRFHEGVDIATSWGHQVVAVAPGTVEFAGWYAGYGRLIIIDHGRGIHTRYAHNSRLLVRPGQQVDRDEVIALSGSSGSSTGPHLHFEVRVNGRPQNPLPWFRR